ncbi:Ubiquinone biosynthesis O-methyltransferase [Candidatus Methanoperedenaceae archaeon GB37]|nr:Ubiquinone biosynthesis O-methyltransferase [Candidatus Methanoperedenaceae archaeon GB37]
MPLNILTFNWHEPYIYLLAKTGHFFEVVLRLKGGRKEWLVEQRPVPENIILISEDHALRKCYCHFYDIIICQNIDDLLLVKDIEIPKILIFHNKLSTEITLGGNTISKEDYLKQVKLLIEQSEPIKLLFISQTKKMDWGLEGYVITPGIDPNEFENYQGHWPKVLRVGNFLKERDIMMGFSLQEEILKGIPSTILGLNPTLPNARFSKSFEDLKKNYSRHRLYLNTTVEDYEDGYNLATLEAMATGMPIVSIANRTSPIIDGVNGYISDNIEYLRERIRMLLMDKGLAKRIGKEARNTVVEKFGIKEFLEKWNEVIENSVNNGKRLRAENDKGLKVLLSYTSNPQTTAAYIEKAMRKICDVITYGPSISKETLIRWNLLAIEDKIKEHQIPFIDGDLKKVFKQLPLGWKPDVFLYIDTGISYPLINLDAIKCIKSCYLIDTHLNLEKHIEIAKNFDVVFIAQKADVKRFKERGIKNVFWIPLACDPEIHGKKTNNKLYDIGFVGSLTDPKRVELLDKLKRRFNLYYERCFLERMAEVFSQSKIVFNKSIKNDLNMRVFEAMASGSMLLTDEAKGSGLTEMFQDRKHLVIYRDEKELFELADYYLRNDDEREKIAKQGMTKVLDRHTYAHRVQEMINIIKDRNNAKEEIRILGNSKDKITSDAIREPLDIDYYRQERKDVEALIPKEARRILDVGCGEGILGKRLLEKGVKEVVGVEIEQAVCEKARENLSMVVCGDIEKIDLPFEERYFDCIVFADILEHLKDPLSVVKKLKKHLKDSGVVVASIPNVRYYQVINMLVDGYWTYGDYGILDRTHLRFFTKKEILALFKNAGFEITTIAGNVDPKYYTVCNSTPAEISFGRISLKDLSSEEIKDLFVFQYLIKARQETAQWSSAVGGQKFREANLWSKR